MKYVSYVIIYSTSLQEYLDKLKFIFNRLRKHNFKIHLDKSEFFLKVILNLCKKLLTNDPILKYTNFEEAFILTTDVSNYGMGAVLSHGKIGSDLTLQWLFSPNSKLVRLEEFDYDINYKKGKRSADTFFRSLYLNILEIYLEPNLIFQYMHEFNENPTGTTKTPN